MSDLTTDQKVYLIECFYSTGKVHANAHRGNPLYAFAYRGLSLDSIELLVKTLKRCEKNLEIVVRRISHTKGKQQEL